jgi:hypothetical protein
MKKALLFLLLVALTSCSSAHRYGCKGNRCVQNTVKDKKTPAILANHSKKKNV